MKKLVIVVSSRSTPEEKKDFIQHIMETCYIDECETSEDVIDVVFNVNPNGESLTKVYNEALDEYDADYFVFIHDDIEFLKKGWGNEIIRLFDEHQDYGIIGVAGSGEFDKDAAWWRYKDIYGQVLHRKDGNSWLTTFSPLLPCDLINVCVVDGLFFAVAKDRISSRFDEKYEGFNFYEISFCLKNYIEGKTKIGVTTNIRIAHNSVGELKPNWYENRDKLNEEFNKYYPIKTKHNVKINR